MKIAIDCRFWGPKHTGLGRYTKNLVLNLLMLDHKDEYFLLFQQTGQQNFKFQISNFKSMSNVKCQMSNVSPYSVKEHLILPKILKKINPDLVHFPHFNTPLFCPYPLVITIHDLIKHHSKGVKTTTRTPWIYIFKYFGYKTVIKNSIMGAEKIIVPSKWVKKELLKHFPIKTNKIEVIYEAAVKTPHSPRTAGRAILNKYKIKKPYIIYTGNVYPHKNLRRLILAVKAINSSLLITHYPLLSLVIVCARDVFWQRLKKQIKELKAEKFVILPGFIPDKDLKILYSQAQAYVSSSLMEGFGLPGIEAMSSACPVVCSNIPTFKEIYKDAAIYFNPENVEDMKEKIAQTVNLSKSKRQHLIKKGKDQAKKYSWKKCAQETLKVYKSIL